MKKNYRINTYHIKPFLVSFGKQRKENGKQKEALSHWKLILWNFHTKNKNKHARSYIFKQLKLTIKNVYKFQLAWLSFFFIYYTSRALLLSHAILPDLCVQKHYWKEQLTLMFHSVFYNKSSREGYHRKRSI